MSIPTMNGVNASNGMQGTTRNDSATFAGPPVAGPAGMAGGTTGTTAATGSSYTKGAGMSGGPLTPWVSGDTQMPAQTGGAIGMVKSGALNGGVVPGQGVASAVPRQEAQQMSQADMQDPTNAAMAGFQFAAGNDAAPSAATGAVQAAPPEPKVNPNYGAGGGTGAAVDSPYSYIPHLRPTNTSISSGAPDAFSFLPEPLRSGNTTVNAGAPDALGFAGPPPPPLRPTDVSIQAEPDPVPTGAPQVQSGKINNDWMNW